MRPESCNITNARFPENALLIIHLVDIRGPVFSGGTVLPDLSSGSPNDLNDSTRTLLSVSNKCGLLI